MKTSSLEVPSLRHDPSTSSSNCMKIEITKIEDGLDRGSKKVVCQDTNLALLFMNPDYITL